jgi:hypothetical protein
MIPLSKDRQFMQADSAVLKLLHRFIRFCMQEMHRDNRIVNLHFKISLVNRRPRQVNGTQGSTITAHEQEDSSILNSICKEAVDV